MKSKADMLEPMVGHNVKITQKVGPFVLGTLLKCDVEVVLVHTSRFMDAQFVEPDADMMIDVDNIMTATDLGEGDSRPTSK